MARGDKLPESERWFVLGMKSYIAGRELSQVKLAEMVGGEPSYLSKVLKETPGKPDFRFGYARALAEAVGADLLEILKVGRDIAAVEDARESTTEESLKSLLNQSDPAELRRFRDLIDEHLKVVNGD